MRAKGRMSNFSTRRSEKADGPALRGGDRMTQEEFHCAYERMPEGYRAELLDGIVHEPSPLSCYHSDYHSDIHGILKVYSLGTDGTKVGIDGTVILGPKDEVQPDVMLCI